MSQKKIPCKLDYPDTKYNCTLSFLRQNVFLISGTSKHILNMISLPIVKLQSETFETVANVRFIWCSFRVISMQRLLMFLDLFYFEYFSDRDIFAENKMSSKREGIEDCKGVRIRKKSRHGKSVSLQIRLYTYYVRDSITKGAQNNSKTC